MKLKIANNKGFTLLEAMVVVVLIAIISAIGIPSWVDMVEGKKLEVKAKSILTGLRAAKSQAVSRNQRVTFNLVDVLDSGCVNSTTGTYWIVTGKNNTGDSWNGACDINIDSNDATANIFAVDSSERTNTINVQADFASITYGGSGFPITIDPSVEKMSSVTISSTGGVNISYKIILGNGGKIELCRPDITDPTDLRYCSI